jgi:hypothetical protein
MHSVHIDLQQRSVIVASMWTEHHTCTWCVLPTPGSPYTRTPFGHDNPRRIPAFPYFWGQLKDLLNPAKDASSSPIRNKHDLNYTKTPCYEAKTANECIKEQLRVRIEIFLALIAGLRQMSVFAQPK